MEPALQSILLFAMTAISVYLIMYRAPEGPGTVVPGTLFVIAFLLYAAYLWRSPVFFVPALVFWTAGVVAVIYYSARSGVRRD
jgi:hypothetical protein